jgi:hypothetical protein
MNEIIEFERREKGKDEVEECCRVKNGVFRIGQKGLAISVGVRPKREIPFLEEADRQLAGRELDDGHVPLEKDPAGEEEFPEHDQEQDEKEGKKEQVLFLVRGPGLLIRQHGTDYYQKTAHFSIF